jgi:alkylated DNA repair protein alkB homolog 1
MDSERSVTSNKARRKDAKTGRNKPVVVGDPDCNSTWTPFRASEKRFKCRCPPPDLSDVLDFAAIDESRTNELARGGWRGRPDAIPSRKVRLTTSDTSRTGYVIPSIPGKIILR